ncbi:siderophore ABC transporter substrate-binding protein [Vibrio salinus]|uniref:siderophore ABC transporter substrate-binding protein n=1 Tax=Vibrio salinus TaxID=2899784 RepID=UPI001E4856C1|nr:siderophore ABC transporter substrate-binding protein [Vibrio salinus]MCE0496068.1 siderophore ABC transporter substrate-binding protein [Vibrio salinus]
MILKITMSILIATISAYVCAEPVTIHHQLGNTQINDTPQRVVVLGVGPLDALDSFGINPVAVTKFSGTPDYLSKYESEQYPSAGSLFEPDFESIYMQKPDLIIIGPRSAKSYKELSEIAPTVVFSNDMDKGYWSSTQQQWRNLGKIFHIEQKVEDKIKKIDAEFKQIKTYNENHQASAMTIMSVGGKISSFGKLSRFSSIYDDFGFREVYQTKKEGPHGDLISYEFIQGKNPDILFIIDKDKLVNHGQSHSKENFNNALIQSTKAYKKGHIVYLDINAWYVSIAGVRSTEQMIRDIKQVVRHN